MKPLWMLPDTVKHIPYSPTLTSYMFENILSLAKLWLQTAMCKNLQYR